MRTIAICVSKGGVGKTTTAVNLAAAAVKDGQRVLLVDMDPQANATFTLRQEDNIDANIMTAMDGEKKTEKIIVHCENGIDLAPAPAQARYETVNQAPNDLREALSQVAADYDVCLIDLGPGYGDLTACALVAANYLIIPVQADLNAAKAVKDTEELIELARTANPGLALMGLLRTRWRTRDRVQSLIAPLLEGWAAEGTPIFETKIRECVGLRQASANQETIFDYALNSVGAEDYENLWKEVQKQIQK